MLGKVECKQLCRKEQIRTVNHITVLLGLGRVLFFLAGGQLLLCSSEIPCWLCKPSYSVLDCVSVIYETQGVCACALH